MYSLEGELLFAIIPEVIGLPNSKGAYNIASLILSS